MADHPSAGGSLELRGVTKNYGIGQGQHVTADDDISFTVAAGAFVALTGASGSGKSTRSCSPLTTRRSRPGASG